MSSGLFRAALSAPVLALCAPVLAAEAQTTTLALAGAEAVAGEADDQQGRDIVVVTGNQQAVQQQPATTETRSAEEISATTSVTNAEDALRYFPNIVVRKRHIGDTQAPIPTRPQA